MKIKKNLISCLTISGVLALIINKSKKDIIKNLTTKIYDREMELDKEYWSLNETIEEFIKGYNKLLKGLVKDCKDYNERLYLLEDEIISIYNHLAELDEIKENKNN